MLKRLNYNNKIIYFLRVTLIIQESVNINILHKVHLSFKYTQGNL